MRAYVEKLYSHLQRLMPGSKRKTATTTKKKSSHVKKKVHLILFLTTSVSECASSSMIINGKEAVFSNNVDRSWEETGTLWNIMD